MTDPMDIALDLIDLLFGVDDDPHATWNRFHIVDQQRNLLAAITTPVEVAQLFAQALANDLREPVTLLSIYGRYVWIVVQPEED